MIRQEGLGSIYRGLLSPQAGKLRDVRNSDRCDMCPYDSCCLPPPPFFMRACCEGFGVTFAISFAGYGQGVRYFRGNDTGMLCTYLLPRHACA